MADEELAALRESSALHPACEEAASDEEHDEIFRHLWWRVVPVLWLGYVLNIVDRTNLGFAALQMQQDLALTAQSFGVASGFFYLSYGLMQVPSNHLASRIGPVRVLAVSTISWGAVSAATSLVGDAAALCALRFLLGLAESAFYPGCLFLLSRWFPPQSLGRAVALFATATSAGGLLSTAGSGLLMQLTDGVRGYVGCSMMLNVSRFFLPTQLREALPAGTSPAQVGWLLAVPAVAKVAAMPLVARYTDAGGHARRLAAVVRLLGAGAGLLLLAATAMVVSSGPPSLGLVSLVAAADVAVQTAVPVFWALHMGGLPAPLAPASIAVVNSVGNLGGFLGPSLVGTVHDATAGEKCGGQCPWGWGLLAVGLAFATITAAVSLGPAGQYREPQL
ncbi:hypothetical protein EMIHUDRAFT_237125 [Emiliania huxleyi CCMP1516]|uniref:Major facilitator superfamily (MFS) profile domain-containing protein n=2 Tax=Emiliania huxleyi TaxID=2903 RepID=A0A0D3JRG8_EMIH1|nr:hypothetical protein EMIHUDRAFT_237125 [Emiliania huxleyi CCMP1516]EOD26103.1 hypothetical protein EMIHUDRAFT_237125 [Emiliania huxleyi CCMP1516]|eukprot:XP_005778532.1 hypothetical protein EMIHUDRAFT_237125 [Emiliania huxleyi CCMP1516]